MMEQNSQDLSFYEMLKAYVESLTKIKNAVISDDVNTYRESCVLVSRVNNTLNPEEAEEFEKHALKSLGTVNLICLACKSNAQEVLQHLLSNPNSICSLPHLAKKNDLLPINEDEENHNAIYYAIRSNKPEILKILIDKWLSDYFEENSELDELLSTAFKDLTIRNVFISKSMKTYVKSKLLDLRFCDENTDSRINIRNFRGFTKLRIDFVLENITNLRNNYCSLEPNEQFLLSLKYIAKNINMLESSVACEEVPWKKIEFCLIIFIRSCQRCFQQYPLYHFVLNKDKLLKHLENFSQILVKLKDRIGRANVGKGGKLSIGKISEIQNIVDFKDLDGDFTQIRDLHSLEIIKSSIDLAMSANVIEKSDQLIIVRALQVIGEYTKNTDSSPNLSDDTSKLLLSSLPDNIKHIVNKLRDKLSHEECLPVRAGIEMCEQNFFKRMQSNITEMNLVITDIIRRKKAVIIRKILSKMGDCKNIDAMKLFLKQNHISAIALQNEMVEAENLNLGSIEQLENLILELEREVKNQISDAKKLFLRIQDIIRSICDENANGSFQGLKSYLPIDPEELLKIYSDFCSVTSVNLGKDHIKIKSTNQGIRLETKFNMPKNIEKYCKLLTNILDKYGTIKLLNFFQKMNHFLDYSDIPHCISALQSKIEAIPVNLREVKQFEKLITNLKKNCDEKARRVEKMFQDIRSLIQNEKTKSRHTQNIFCNYLNKLITVIQFHNEKCSHTLETPMLDFEEAVESLTLLPFSKKFSAAFQDITSELVKDNFSRGINFLTALGKIHEFLEFHLGKIKWITEFKLRLEDHEKPTPKSSEKELKKDEIQDLLPTKLTLLDEIIIDYKANKLSKTAEKLKLLSVIEMLILDSITILGFPKERLPPNAFFLDTDYPVVNGRNLRNHLAHGNVIVNIVLGHDSTDVLLNAEKLIAYNKRKDDRPIGKKLANNPHKLKVSLDKDLLDVNEQLKLFAALSKGEMERVKECLGKGADMFGKDLYSQTSLHFAAKGSCLKTMKFVLKLNLDAFAVDVNLQTVLHVASSNGRLAVVKFLIDEQELNALVNEKDIYGRTPLHLASIDGSKDIVKCLLKHKAEVAIKDISGNTALHYAVIHNHEDIFNILLEKEANDNINNTFSEVLNLASEAGHVNLLTTVLEKPDINLRSSSNFFPLHYAARGGHANVVEILINKGINSKNLHGNTPLHLAAERGHDKVVEKLLQKGADINAANLYDLTALSLAAKGGHADVVEVLINKGADINSKNLHGNTPLHLAAERGHDTVVEKSFQQGADINAANLYEEEEVKITEEVKISFWNPLNLAVKIGGIIWAVSKLLLEKLMIADGIQNSLYCPIILAAKFGHHELVKKLLSKCGTSSKILALHWAALKGHLSVVKLLVNEGINAEFERSGCTALHLAACEGHTGIVEFLIKKGYDKKVNSKINSKDLEKNRSHEVQDSWRTAILFTSGSTEFDDESQFSGTTALHLSAFGKHKDIVRILLKIPADINVKDHLGTTPLQAIISNGMAYILVEESIPITSVDCYDIGPLALGAALGDLKFVKHCIEKGYDKDAKLNLFIRLYCLLFQVDISALDAKNKALLAAVNSGHDEVVEHLIEKKANVNAKTPDGFSILDHAVEAKRKKIVKILIDSKKVEMSSEKERKYLLSAIRSGHEELVEYFLSRNPENSASRPECKEFPLHTAVQYGHLNIVKQLLKIVKKDDINIENENAATPLQLASGQGYCEIARLLLLKWADPNKPDHLPPLSLAVTNGDLEMIEILTKAGARISQRDAQVYSAIESEIKNRSLDTVKRLLELLKIDNSFRDHEGLTILHHAAVSGSLETVKSLAEAGVSIDVRDSTNAKPIHIAAREGHQDIVAYFLDKGLDIGDRGHNGWCLLHYAAAGNQAVICEFLLRNGLDVNDVDADDNTPLHVAAQKGSTDVLHFLLHHGAYYDARNKRDETPFNVTMALSFESTSHSSILAFLAFISSLFSAVQKNDLPKVEASLTEVLNFRVLSYGNIKNAKNISLLQYAVEEGNQEIVDILLK